ncbi:hypothetical protein RJI07_06210 [Mycoplasmatota bacterium WC30]
MKKIFIFLFICVLLGCDSATTENNTEVTSLEDITTTTQYFIRTEVDVCLEDCGIDLNDYTDYLEGYQDQIDEMLLVLSENMWGEVNLLSGGETYLKEEIPRLDPVSDNYDIPIVVPYREFQGVLSMMTAFVSRCTLDECGEPYSLLDPVPSNIDYGFSETEGYLSYTLGENQDIEQVNEIRYIIRSDYVFFENLRYHPKSGVYWYSFFDGVEYKEYKYTSDNHMYFTYVNLDTYQTIFYSLKEEDEHIAMYDHDSHIEYERRENQSSTVSFFDDMEFVASINKDNDNYEIKIGFHYMSGWDSMFYKGSNVTPNSQLYFDGNEVFTDYSIVSHNQGLRYYRIKGTINLSESEFADYDFPVEFTGSITRNELNQELEYLIGLEQPSNVAGLNREDIIQTFIELTNWFETTYIEE